MIYRHYKGRYYRVLGEGFHTETDEVLVIYQGENGMFWARPREMFHSQVQVGDEWVPRFELVPFQSDPAGPTLPGENADV